MPEPTNEDTKDNSPDENAALQKQKKDELDELKGKNKKKNGPVDPMVKLAEMLEAKLFRHDGTIGKALEKAAVGAMAKALAPVKKATNAVKGACMKALPNGASSPSSASSAEIEMGSLGSASTAKTNSSEPSNSNVDNNDSRPKSPGR